MAKDPTLGGPFQQHWRSQDNREHQRRLNKRLRGAVRGKLARSTKWSLSGYLKQHSARLRSPFSSMSPQKIELLASAVRSTDCSVSGRVSNDRSSFEPHQPRQSGHSHSQVQFASKASYAHTPCVLLHLLVEIRQTRVLHAPGRRICRSFQIHFSSVWLIETSISPRYAHAQGRNVRSHSLAAS